MRVNIIIRFSLVVLCVALLAVITACSRKSIRSLQRTGVNVADKAIIIGDGAHHKSLQVQYLGCGGLYIYNAGQGIMIDPFFSHQGFLTIGRSMLGLGSIRCKPSSIAYGRQRILDSLHLPAETFSHNTKAILAAHGHYDHLMDIPYIQQHWFEGNADVYVNTSSANTCAGVITTGKLHDVEGVMSVRQQQGGSIDLSADDGSVMKIYPILAAHNPHAHHVKLFSGSVMKPPAHFKDVAGKTSINDWLEGRTLSFLIDIELGGEIMFRIYVQSSSCHFPDGLPPEQLLSEKAIDLAVMGVASYQFSETTYPCRYLETIKPRNLMFIHWEDFFRNYKRKPKTVIKTNVSRFFNEVLPRCNTGNYVLPAPGVVVTVKY